MDRFPETGGVQGTQGAQRAEKMTLKQTLTVACAGVGTVCRYCLAGSTAKPVTHHPSSSRSGTRRQERKHPIEQRQTGDFNHIFLWASTRLDPRCPANDSTHRARDLRPAASFHVTGHVRGESGETDNRKSAFRELVGSAPIFPSFRYSLFANVLPSPAGPTTVGLFPGSYLIALAESHHLNTRRTIETFPLNGKYSLAAPMIILAADAKRICMTVKKCPKLVSYSRLLLLVAFLCYYSPPRGWFYRLLYCMSDLMLTSI